MIILVLPRPDGVLAASCALAIMPNLTRGGHPYGLIGNVVTHGEHRRRGHGTAVLHAAMQAAREADCYKLTLDTGSKQEGTLLFYEAAGFARCAKTNFEIRWS